MLAPTLPPRDDSSSGRCQAEGNKKSRRGVLAGGVAAGGRVEGAPVRGIGEVGGVDIVSRVDVHESTAVRVLNAMNEGFGSLREVDFPAYGVARPSMLVSLSLHSNKVSSLEGFESMTVSMCCVCLCAFACVLGGKCVISFFVFCSSQQQQQLGNSSIYLVKHSSSGTRVIYQVLCTPEYNTTWQRYA